MPIKPRILLVDDQESTLQSLVIALRKHNYELHTATNGVTALQKADEVKFDLAVLDIVLPDIDGISLMQQIRTNHPNTKILLITAQANLEQAVHAMQKGASNYLSKPFTPDVLNASIKEALLIGKDKASHSQDIFWGDSKVMLDLKEKILKLAPENISIWLNGETGVGKEVIAKFIHANSKRYRKSFVALNCPAIPENLFESEVFGHKKGSFTGAHQDRIGKFKIANNGTLFFDEILDLHVDNQTKLLRVLQERQFEALGSNKIENMDIRFLAASSLNVNTSIKVGSFRKDLLYRLADITLEIPPLRDRSTDIPKLIERFSSEFESPDLKINFNGSAIELLQSYSWPGNIRELKSVIRRLCILHKNQLITADHISELLPKDMNQSDEKNLGTSNISPTTQKKTELASLVENEKKFIEETIVECKYNMTKAAKRLGIGRTTLYRKIKKYKIAA